MAAKKGGLGKGLDSLLVNKVNADHSSDSTIVKEKSTTTKIHQTIRHPAAFACAGKKRIL